ncbi:MAG: sigma-70 family RNA polymerase sigma factor [Planctomyces sp.]|nr:sigma-70 family RNA polymerase sigma factor [Planctomyces sp.]
MTSETDPPDLRPRLRAAPEQVLAEEFARHRGRLFRIVRFRLDPQLASRLEPDDVLQEAWLAALRRIDHFLEHDSYLMFVWLRLVVAQTIVDIHRHHLGSQMRDAYRELTLNQRELSNSTAASIVSQLLGRVSSPSQAAVREETARQLRASLDAMDPIDREVLALRHFEELGNQEIAAILEISPKAASIRYVRALQRLKRILDTLPGFHGSLDVPSD